MLMLICNEFSNINYKMSIYYGSTNSRLCYINNSSFSIDSYINDDNSTSNVRNSNNICKNENTIAIPCAPQDHDERGQRLYQPIINNNYIVERKGKVEDKLMNDKKRYDEKCIRKRLNEAKKLQNKRLLATKLNPHSIRLLSNPNPTPKIRKKVIESTETFHPKINEYSLQLLERNTYHYNDHYDDINLEEAWYIKSKVIFIFVSLLSSLISL